MRKKKLTTLALCFVMAILLLPITASADTGPKPSVRITFENMGDETCYAAKNAVRIPHHPRFRTHGRPSPPMCQ